MWINASAATRHTAYSIYTKHPRHQEDTQHERPCARASVSRAWVLGSDGTENPGSFSCLPSSKIGNETLLTAAAPAVTPKVTETVLSDPGGAGDRRIPPH